jgi:ABC-2 type transport system permease protein
MTAFTKLTAVEAKLLVRDRMTLVWGVAFPTALLLVVGAFMPGFQEATEDLGGLRPVDVYAPIVLALALIMLAIGALPSHLAAYREQGVLRRLGTTPMPPSRLLVAHLGVQLALGVVAAALAIAAGVVAFGMPLPERLAAFVLAFVLAAASLLALGLLVGALVPDAKVAQVVTTVLWIPLMFLAGLWYPREEFPDALRHVSDLSPAGAGVQALQDAWFGNPTSAYPLLVMLVFTVVAGAVAARTFRWE